MDFSPTYKRIFRTDDERQNDLPLIIDLKNEGHTWAEITDKLNGRSEPYTVTQREITQQYYAFIRSNTSIIDKELESMALADDLDRVFQLAYDAYVGTQKPTITEKKEMISKTGDISDDLLSEVPDTAEGKKVQEELSKRLLTIKPGKANNAFLNTMIKCIETRAKILNIAEEASYQQVNIPVVTEPARISAPVQSERELLQIFEEIHEEE